MEDSISTGVVIISTCELSYVFDFQFRSCLDACPLSRLCLLIIWSKQPSVPTRGIRMLRGHFFDAKYLCRSNFVSLVILVFLGGVLSCGTACGTGRV